MREASGKKLANDEKLPFPLHDDISRTESYSGSKFF